SDQFADFFLRVAAAFFAEAERAEAGRLDEASPPLRPPLREAALLSFVPRPEPDFLPPPSSLLTVAQARRSASSLPTPFLRYPSSLCSVLCFCLSVLSDLSPRGMVLLSLPCPPGPLSSQLKAGRAFPLFVHVQHWLTNCL